jgi:folate-binding protein YgfZ
MTPPGTPMASDSTLLVLESRHGVLVVRGPDRKSWLNGVVTCDVNALGPERGVVGLFLNKQGKVRTDLILLEGGEQVLVRIAPERSAPIFTELDRMLVMEDAELVDQSEELAFLSLHGPRALELARNVTSALAFGRVEQTAVEDVALVVPRGDVDAVVAGLEAQGAVRDDGQGWLALRVASGWPEFEVDYGDADNAHEAALDRRAVSWSKGCYLGQEVVCMQDMRGKVKRRVVPFELEGTEVPPAGTEVRSAAGESIGRVTSAAKTEGGQVLALGMLKAPHFNAGSAVLVGAAEGRVLAVPSPASGKA